jgi:copper chaperone CopZ
MRIIKCGIIFFLTVACTLHVFSQFTEANLQASGLTCALCSNAINKALQKLPFVASVRPDIKNSSFDVVFKEGDEASIDELKNAVENAGFSVASLKITGNFDNIPLQKDGYTKIGNQAFYFLNASGGSLQGQKTLTIVEKSFMTTSSFKKYSDKIKPASSSAITGNKLRVYHAIVS